MIQDQAQNDQSTSRKVANLSIAFFFLVSSLSLIILITMFILVWQPIWSDGFKDFHTISTAIHKLDETAKPATDTIPSMLKEMHQMNQSMTEMVVIMKTMNKSVAETAELTPAIERMSGQMERITFLLNRIENKLPATNRLPFWN